MNKRTNEEWRQERANENKEEESFAIGSFGMRSENGDGVEKEGAMDFVKFRIRGFRAVMQVRLTAKK